LPASLRDSDLFSGWDARQRNAIAVALSDGSSLTYRELHAAVSRARSRLADMRLVGKRIILAAPSSVEHVVLFYAAISSGCSVIPWAASARARALANLERETEAAAILRTTGVPRRSLKESEPRDGEVIHATSGSSGSQKLVVRPFGNLATEARAVALALRLEPGQNVVVASPLTHSFGCGMLRATLAAGATLCAPEGTLPHRLQWIKTVLGRQANVVTAVPQLYALLLRDGRIGRSQSAELRCYAGGAPLSSQLSEGWRRATGSWLGQEYGLGEGGIVTFASPGDPSTSVGRPIPGVSIRLDGGSQEGEIIVYRPDAPRRYLIGDSSDRNFLSDGGVRTGDLARMDPEGRYYLLGRLSHVINVAGEKISPREIEECLESHPDVVEAVVIAVPDQVAGERPAAVVEARSSVVTERECIALARTNLSPSRALRRVLVVTSLPRTASGKADRPRLKQMLLADCSDTGH